MSTSKDSNNVSNNEFEPNESEKSPETPPSEPISSKEDIEEAIKQVKNLAHTLGRIIMSFLRSLISPKQIWSLIKELLQATLVAPFYCIGEQLKKALTRMWNDAKEAGKWIVRAFGELVTFICETFRLIVVSMALGRSPGILLSTIFATIITSSLYWCLNNCVLNYDVCYARRETDKAVSEESISAGETQVANAEIASSETPPPEDFDEEIASNAMGKRAVTSDLSSTKNPELKDSNIPSYDEKNFYSITNDDREGCYDYIIAKNNGTAETDNTVLFRIRFIKDAENLVLELLPADSDKPIDWTAVHNTAQDNVIFRLRETCNIIKRPTFPTNTGSFLTCLKDNGPNIIPALKEVHKDDPTLLAEQLETRFKQDWLVNDNSSWLLIVGRSMNGWIQFATFVAFNAMLLCLGARYLIFVFCGRLPSDKTATIKTKNLAEWLKEETPRACENQDNFRNNWGLASPRLFVWTYGLLAISEPNSPRLSKLTDLVNDQETKLENSRSFSNWLLQSISGCGFIGTVIGIGQTMMGVGAIIQGEKARVQSSITEVAMNLAFAFDTTLVALILSLIASFLAEYVFRREFEELHATRELLIHILDGNKGPEPDASMSILRAA